MNYTVKVGDTLWAVAARLCGDPGKWRGIAEDNKIGANARIMVGDELSIRDAWLAPAAQTGATAAGQPPAGAGQEHRGSLIPGRAFTFVLADEINPVTRKVVRRVLVNPRMAAEISANIGRQLPVFPHPERFGLRPSGPSGSPITAGRHAMNFKPSPFMSASSHPLGAQRFKGSPFWIDVDRARAAGATFHETEEIIADLKRIAAKTRKPADLAKIEHFKKLVIGDKEVLIRGAVPAAAVKGAGAMALTRGLQGVQIVSFVVTAADLGRAGEKSIATGSVRPISAESVRQAGSWASAWATAKLGASVGALMGIETGPGAVLFAAGGAVAGGFFGYLGFDWIADHIDAN